MKRAHRVCVALALLSGACGGAVAQTPPVPASTTQNPLACAGRSLEDSVAIPELGPRPNGDPVTGGVALSCSDDELRVMDWGPDSSAVYTVGRAHAMELWDAFQAPLAHEERVLTVQRFLERERLERERLEAVR